MKHETSLKTIHVVSPSRLPAAGHPNGHVSRLRFIELPSDHPVTLAMNPADTLKQALDSVIAEEKRLGTELAKVRAVRQALEAGLRAKDGKATSAPKALPGGLRTAILGVLGKQPMANADIRETLSRAGYAYSLTPLHVSKTLTKLLRAKKVKRIGTGSLGQYVKA